MMSHTQYYTLVLSIQTQLVADRDGLGDHRINLYKTYRTKHLLCKLDLKYPTEIPLSQNSSRL